ncbi:MAG: Ig-like domain-containing protein [Alistipes sp.]|nr:Ig-like domain-containing protein [Alistipes sp.]
MNNRRQKYAAILRTAAALLVFSGFFSRCASIMTPQGGPKDTIPPVIVAMQPDNFTTNFKDKKIYIEFNEFVQLKDQNKEFFTSPAMKKKPLLSLRGKGVVVQIRDTLLENTTYALNFGSTIRDNNEGNPLNAMRYVFSTGDKVDSLLCSGYTADSYKADSVSKTFIYFYPADSIPDTLDYDSTIFNLKPAAIARAENNGIFIAQNLKPIPYRIYAVQDKNDNQMYEAGTDQIGFLEGTYNPAELPEFAIWFDSLRMYPSAEPQLYFRMFTDEAFKRQLLSASERPQQHKALLYFGARNPQIESIKFDSIPADRVIIDPQTVGRDTIALWFHVPAADLPDTIRGEITYFKHDSVRRLEKTTEQLKLAWRYIETKEEERERIKQEKEKERAEKAGETYEAPKKPNPFKFKMPASGDINPEQHLTVEFDYPLAALDSAAVQLSRVADSGEEVKVPATFERDTSDIRRWRIKAKWAETAKYNLLIPAGAVTDIAGLQNDTIKGSYTALDHEKYATVIVNVKTKGDGTKYIVQLTNAAGALQQERRDVTDGKIQFNYVPAGEIKLRIIEDTNGNGKWDSGNVVERRQPERSEMYVNDKGENTFATKANWEMELDMDMAEIFAPVTMESLIRMLDEREEQRLKKLEEEREKKNKSDKKDEHNHDSGNQNGGGFGMGGMFNTGGLKQGMGNLGMQR